MVKVLKHKLCSLNLVLFINKKIKKRDEIVLMVTNKMKRVFGS